MSQRPFRFLHTSDLHFDTPPSGMTEIHAHLRRTMLDAASDAFAQLVDTALAENVDFVVFAGDMIEADQAGPRLLSQFCTQLERLADASIAVYWASGEADAPPQWPSAIRLPVNVHRFAAGPVTRIKHQRDDRPLAELVGTSQPRVKNIQVKDYLSDAAVLPTVVVAHGTVDARKIEKHLAAQDSPSYWALGGQHARDTVLSRTHVVHYPGTPQARCPSEQGPHGATLAEFDPAGSFHTSFIETDVLRWCDEVFEVDNHITLEQLEKAIRKRLDSLAEIHASRTLMVACSIDGTGPLVSELRTGTLATDLSELLQVDYGQRDSPLWVSRIAVATSKHANARHTSRDTILSDYLHTITAFENGEQSLDFRPLLPDQKQLAGLATDFELSEQSEITSVLAMARSRGIDLLGGEPQHEQAVVAGGTQA